MLFSVVSMDFPNTVLTCPCQKLNSESINQSINQLKKKRKKVYSKRILIGTVT